MTAKRRIIPIFVPHSGCPHDCVFCNQRRISGRTEPQTGTTARRIIEDALGRIPAGAEVEAAFYGGSFTAIPRGAQEELLGAVLPFLRSGRVSSVRVSTRPDCIGREELDRLKKYGVRTVELGVQSMCPDVLEKSNRGHTPEDAEKAAALIREYGFDLILQMMTGLPGDTREKSVYTAERLAGMKPSGVRIYPTVVVRDTELYDMWRRGEYAEHTVEEAVALCAELWEIFEDRGIKIIRLGLNPTEELSQGAAAAGAYHPAFGELVLSRRYLHKAEKLFEGLEAAGKEVVIGVAPGQVSAMTGQRRGNILKLEEKFSPGRIKVRETTLKKGEIVILSVAKQDVKMYNQ